MALLEIKNLTKSFKEQIVLENISLSFPSNGLITIIGESGSGKSTLLKCLLGIEKMDKGEVYFKNKKIKNFNKFRNESTSYIFQNYSLISFLSPYENINLNNRNNNDNNVLFYAEKSNIKHKLKQNASSLSGGEKQRIALARALISSSSIILCDEPTGSLDKDNANEIMALLKDISKEKLVVVVTHNLEHASLYSDQIVALKNKKVEVTIINKIEEKNDGCNKKYNLPLIKTLKLCFAIFKTQIRKIIFSLLSLGLSLSFFLLSLNTYSSVQKIIEDNSMNFLDYNFTRLSLIKETSLENSNFSLVKNIRPSTKDMEYLNDLLYGQNIQFDLSPFIPTYPKVFKDNTKQKYLDKIEFVPYLLSMHRHLETKIDGDKPKRINEVIANEKAKELLSQNNFYLDLSLSIDYKTKENKIITDNVNKEMKMEIVGIFHEFTLVETPRIYYPYDYLEGVVKEIPLYNLSSYFNCPLYLYDRLTNYTYENDPLVSYSYVLEIKDIDKVKDIYKKINNTYFDNNHFSLENSSLELINSFNSLFDSIYEVISIFIIITMIISIFLLGLTMDSIVNDNKKDIGIMLCIGILKSDIKIIYLICSILVGIVSSFLSIIFYSLGARIINFTLLSNISLVSIPNNISLRNFVIGAIFVLFLSVISSIISLLRIDKMQIGEIMREE